MSSFFFFFKQKTAYEISACLVGSEMCIRDRRATAQHLHVASLMGIDTGRVFALTWAVGVTCVGVAGVLLAPIYPVYPTVGLQFVLIAYVAVVLGGLGDMAGALIASLIVAAVEVIGSYVIGTAWKEVLYLL